MLAGKHPVIAFAVAAAVIGAPLHVVAAMAADEVPSYRETRSQALTLGGRQALLAAEQAGRVTSTTIGGVQKYIDPRTGVTTYVGGPFPQATGAQPAGQPPAGSQAYAPQQRATGQGGAIVYLPEAAERPIPYLQITEKQRAAEHAKHEAEQRRRAAAGIVPSSRPAPQAGQAAAASAPVIARTELDASEESWSNEQARAGLLERAASLRSQERVTGASSATTSEARAREILSDLR